MGIGHKYVTIMVVKDNNYHANFQAYIGYPVYYSFLTQKQAHPSKIGTGSAQVRPKTTQLK